jgi:RHS repeat-associated protein
MDSRNISILAIISLVAFASITAVPTEAASNTRNITIGAPGYQISLYDLGQTNYYPYPSTIRVKDTPFVERWRFSANGDISAKSGDINGDGKLEIVLTDGQYLRDLNSEGKEIMRVSTTAGLGILGDATGDGIPEIFLCRTDGSTGRIFAYRSDGDLVKQFTSDMTPQNPGWPTNLFVHAVADIDGDGDFELIATKMAGYSLQPRGVLLFDYNTATELWYHSIGPFPGYGGIADIAAADIAASPTREIVFGSGGPANWSQGADGSVDYRCYTFCLQGNDGSTLWRDEYEGSGFVDSSVAVADIDGDGHNDVVATSFSHGWNLWDGSLGRVYILDPNNGNILRECNFQKPVWMGGLADLNNDGKDEIIVCEKDASTQTGSVIALDRSLNVLNRFSVPGAPGLMVQVITDINGDGYNEVVVAFGGIAYVLDHNLSLLWSLPLPGSASGLFVSDLDGDGALEMVIPSGTILYVFEPISLIEGSIDSPIHSGEILVGDSLRFSGHSIVGAGAGPPQYLWDFGDGRSCTLEDPGLVSFTTAGTKLIILDVNDRQGNWDVTPDRRSITVVAQSGSVPDLAVTQLNVPANLAINQPTEISYTVQNIGDGNVSGKSWRDALYLSRDQYLDVCDLVLVSAQVSKDVPVGNSYTNTLTVTIPTVEEGAYYLLLVVDDKWDVLERHQLNNEFAVATDLVIPHLSDGVPLVGKFTTDGDTRYYRVDVPPGRNLFVRLDEGDNLGTNELYARFGSLPTRGTYDYRASAPGSADQQVLIPAATVGTWYVLAYGESVSGNGEFTIEADISGLKITGVTPTRHGNNAIAVLTVTGAGFDATTDVNLVSDVNTIYLASEVSVDSYTQLTVTFDLASVPTGIYTLRVSSPTGGTSELHDIFEVVSGGGPKLQTNLVVPSWVGRHAVDTLYIEYGNTGQVAMPAPLLVLHGTDRAFLTLDQSKVVSGFWTSATPEGFSDTVQILASGATPGVLQPGESFRVPVYFTGLQQPWDFSDNQVEFNLGVLSTDNTTPVDWDALKSQMKPDYVRADAWDVIWANFTAQAGSTWGSYLRMLDENAAYLGRIGSPTSDISELQAFEFRQADGINPLNYLVQAVDAAVSAPGLQLVFQRAYAQPISRRYELGALGRCWVHNWQYSLTVAGDGTVTITDITGTPRVFQPDSRPGRSYLAQPGDSGTLTATGIGVFQLREADGTLYVFRADGKLDYIEDTNGNRITCGYMAGQLTSLTHSSGQSLTIVYNAAGRISEVTDSDGRQTFYTYDASNERLISAQDYDGRVTKYAYSTGQGADREHAITEISYPGDIHRYFAYDAQGRLSETYRDGGVEQVRFCYDSTGTVTATDALGNPSRFCFDDWGRLIKTQNALGNAVYLAFDELGNLTRITDPFGRSFSYNYDSKGNLIRTVDSLGNVTRFAYTFNFNRLAQLTDTKGNITKYQYDSYGNLKSITYADTNQERWDYDDKGNATTWTNCRGRPIKYEYDSDGHITTKVYADNSRIDYIYDPNRCNLLSVEEKDSNSLTIARTTFTYDANDYLTLIDYPGGRYLTFTYDQAGRRKSSTDQLGHTLIYYYDSVGRLERIESKADANSPVSEIVHYYYDAAGRLQHKVLGNGMYTMYEYDAAGQLLHLVNYLSDNSVISHFDYTYDSRGKRTSMDMLDGKWTYEYDDIGQLTHAVFVPAPGSSIPAQDLTYVYDALGNRIRTIENGVTANYTTNNMNQYIQVGNTTYVFDADGNLIEERSPAGTTSYIYSDENRLIAVSKDTDTWQYTYDAFGNRIATTENGETTRYVVDPLGLGNVIGEYDGSGNLIAHYDHGFGLLSRSDPAGNPAFYIFDAVGNVHQLATAVGTIANSYAYTPFGVLLRVCETMANPFKYVGELGVMNGSNDLAYMRARLYASRIGRFTTADPIGLLGADMNFYRYVWNDPIRTSDPHGTHCGEKRHGWLWIHGYLVHGDYLYEFNPIGGPLAYVTNTDPYISTLGVHTVRKREKGKWGPPIVLGYEPYEIHRALGARSCWDVARAWQRYFCGLSKDPPDATKLIPPISDLPSHKSGVASSLDPNRKIGPGWYIQFDELLAYRVDFENDPNATAPAQQVIVTDPLDSDLGWTTFQLTEIGFGDQLIVIPANTQHYETTIPVECNNMEFEVQVEAGIHSTSGQVYATFRSIDPNTGLPPTVNIGFLPPENGTGRGQGHISYTIKPKADLPIGTQITNSATISFDLNPPMKTGETSNIIWGNLINQPVDDLVSVSVGQVGYDRRTGQFGVDVTVTNTSQTAIGIPVWLVIKNVSDPNVTLAGNDGTTADGKPYIDLSGLLGDGQLDPSESVSKRIYFNNPKGVRFTFEPSVWGVILGTTESTGLSDLAELSGHWLGDEPSLDVAPPGGDGVINFLDFAVLAEHWLEGTTP